MTARSEAEFAGEHTSPWLEGGGEAGALIRARDWSATPLGPPRHWPSSLKTAIAVLLRSRHPMFLWWGPDLIQFYNDAYRPSFGEGKHPAAIGQRGAECWQEIWPIIWPQIDDVMTRGKASWNEDHLVPIFRNGRIEEVYWTYGYSPILDDSGNVGGTLVVCTETTGRVISERRLRVQGTLLERTASTSTPDRLMVDAAETFSTSPNDIPFALFYLADSATSESRLVESIGVHGASLRALDRSIRPRLSYATLDERVSLAEAGPGLVIRAGPWPEPITDAFISPFAAVAMPSADAGARGFVVFGLSPRLEFDRRYRDSLTRLTQSLTVAFERVDALRSLERANSERERLLVDARRAREAAEQANLLKDHFLATVSHELRTPLNSMLGWARLLVAGELPADKWPKALATIERNAVAQAQLVDDLLDVSRIVSGKLRLDTQPVQMAKILESALEAVRLSAHSKGVNLRLVLESDGGTVDGDCARLQQVLMNLLSNAIKFTSEGGDVTLRLVRAGNSVEVAVADTGRGIAPEFLPHVFDRFRQADPGSSRSVGGLGLGLTIAKTLVELHRGTLVAESPGEGKGATFTVRLPLAGAFPIAPFASSRSTRVVAESIPGARPPYVVILDDDADSRDLLAALLEHYGLTVTTATSVAEALDRVAREKPDAVVSDIAMPGEDGYEFLRQLRARPEEWCRRVPVVALTAYARSEDRTRVLRAGFAMYLPKPVDGSELLSALANVIEKGPRPGL